MSVTFNAASTAEGSLVGYAVSCFAYGPSANYRSDVFDSSDKAIANHEVEHNGNEDCDQFVTAITCLDTDNDPFVNMNNSNAGAVLRTIGLLEPSGEISYCGSMDCSTFRGKVSEALSNVTEDPALPSLKIADTTGPSLYFGGRSENYLKDRLADLLDLADFAESKNSRITWG